MAHYFEFNNVSYSKNNEHILTNVSFSIPRQGDTVAILGPSGIGKTTILKCISGVRKIDQGTIQLKNKILHDAHTYIDPEQRNIALSFQDNALFPHYTVEENIRFGIQKSLFCSKNKNGPLKYSMEDLLELFFVPELKNKYPHEISTGQAQRVGLVRSIIHNPDLLLLDEPFANLDQNLKDKAQKNLKEILKSTGITTILVTHDKYEAFYLSDYCGILLQGGIVQFDSPYNIHHIPNSKEVVEFFNRGVLIPVEVVSDDTLFNKDLGEIKGKLVKKYEKGEQVNLLIQPEDLEHDDSSALKFEVIDKKFRGTNLIYTLQTPSALQLPVFVHSHHEHLHAEQEKFGIKQPIFIDHLVCF
ncbi:MAG: ABC transporter ATP-binding protein [Proteobacteria bacterium]|nr:ABC transporter ATP-binding protein [Pseudomonadota bacterium]MDA0971999.1 ABC transporter ATP-binding protein [Pseudomonadota bacterium]MDA0996531.1 ABC transporter ATP-binding protein [Pseudomonadota bacterium]